MAGVGLEPTFHYYLVSGYPTLAERRTFGFVRVTGLLLAECISLLGLSILKSYDVQTV